MRHRKNLRVALATSVTLVAGTLATVAVTASPAQAATEVKINLVGINDFHGRIDANTVKWAGTVEQLKASPPNPIVVGAGDLIGASTFASAVANDEPTIDVMNQIGMKASAVGNHEFDKGWTDLHDRVLGSAGARGDLGVPGGERLPEGHHHARPAGVRRVRHRGC